jgi:hypothetical protein
MPTEIVGQLDRLAILSKQKHWDGPETVAEVRNAIAHPARKDDVGVAFEASQLTMWYLEMALLYLFKFTGECANRTVFHKPWFAREKVPWHLHPECEWN